jgi:hypothetical protein
MNTIQFKRIIELQRLERRLWLLSDKAKGAQRAWVVEQITSTRSMISQLQNQ